jgi:hypothetical protein
VRFALLALVIQIPFELRYTVLGLTNLQWTFVVLGVAAAPGLLKDPKSLLRDRLVQAAILFVGLQWLAALYAPDFNTNALKAAGRFTAGLLLLLVAVRFCQEDLKALLLPAWAIVSVAAAVYGLAEYAGFGLPWLFRTQEFYVGQLQRLSGSFGYPNIAAAYFAMSLPIVWWSRLRPLLRGIFVCLLFCAVVLSFSKGALLAVPAVALVTHRKAALPLIALGIVCYAALLPLSPYLIERLQGPTEPKPLGVTLNTPWNHMRLRPDIADSVPLKILNTGITTFQAQGRLKSSVAYRWWNMETETFVDATIPIVTPLPQDIPRGESTEVDVRFQTPVQPGRYLLVLDLFSANFDWLTRTGTRPKLIQVDVEADASRYVGDVDLSAFDTRGQEQTSSAVNASRSSLWKAALWMFVAHSFGVGPDNYRLNYGKYLGAKAWDTNIYSNNLYLELLTGSGIAGLAAFALVLAARRWNTDPESLAVAVFLVHGIVDVFMMTTPIYFAFWLLMGINSRSDSTASHRS